MKGEQFEFTFIPEPKKTSIPDIPEMYLGLLDQSAASLGAEITRIEALIRDFNRQSDPASAQELQEYIQILNQVIQYKNAQEAS